MKSSTRSIGKRQREYLSETPLYRTALDSACFFSHNVAITENVHTDHDTSDQRAVSTCCVPAILTQEKLVLKTLGLQHTVARPDVNALQDGIEGPLLLSPMPGM